VVAIVEPGLGLSPWTSAIARITGTGPATGVDLADAISSALHSLPAVLVVDDLDRRDELATHILERAAPALAATPIAHTAGIIATVSVHGWRPVDPTGISEAELRPLDAADTAAWCASVLGEQPAESLIEYVVARAGGSPALAVETMRDLLDSGALSRVGGNWFFDEDRAGAIESRSRDRRLDGLSARERSVLEALAIFSGRPVALDVLASVSDVEPPELAAAIERLCSAQLARVAEGRLLPTSEAVRAHCERALSARRRTGLHRRAHSALARAGETDPSALCAHALAAGARDVAIDLAARAADAGLARDDYLAALAATELGERAAPDAEIRRAFLLRRARAMVGLLRPADAASTAAEVLSQDPGNREAALIFARALVTAGDGLRARPAIAELAAVGADPLEVATLEVEAAWLLRNPAEVIELGEALLARLASDPSRDPQRARVHLTMSQATVGTGDPQRATVEATRASELFERHSDFAGVATAQAFLAAAADVVGDDAALDTHLARGLDAAHRSGSHSAASRLFNIRGISRLWGGLNDDAAEAFAEAERRGRRAGLAKVSAAAAGNLVAVHRRQGLFGSALQAAARSIRIKRQFDDKNAVLTTVSNITAVLNQLGSFEAAVGGSRRVLSHASEIGDGRMMAHATLERGWIEIERDNAEVGLELIARLDRDETLHMDARNADAVDIIRCIGLARVGERPRALDILRDIAERAHDRYDVAWACYERGAILGDVGQEDLRRAVEQAHACNAREYAWCALARLGLVFLAAGRTQDARLELRRAKEIRDEILADLPVRHRARYLGTRRHAELSAAVDRAAVEFAGEDWPAPAEPGDEDDEGTGATSAITTPSSPSGEDPA
jgi:tetratricopeptide (TPR) repeat protein